MANIVIFDQYVALGWMAARVSSVVSSFRGGVVYSAKQWHLFIVQTVVMKSHATVNFVYVSKPGW